MIQKKNTSPYRSLTGPVGFLAGVKHSSVHYDHLALSAIADYKALVIFDPSCDNCYKAPAGGH